MLELPDSVRAWRTPRFEAVLRQELAQQAERLPLQRALAQGNALLDTPLTVTLLDACEQEGVVRVKVGVFFQSLIAGCSCADDPTPISALNEYAELLLALRLDSARASVEIVS
ncbi:MAG: hypothetical protein Fur0040_09120 [Sideroxydans sp.]